MIRFVAILLLLVFIGTAFANQKLFLNGNTTTQGPSITAQTASFTIIAGNTKTLSITANGTPPLSIQWFKNNVAVTAASAPPTYTTPILVQADNGAIFTAKVTNAFGVATSQPIQATVNTDITINVQPQTQTVTAPTAATFTVAATGGSALTCQWFRNGTAISTNGTSCSSYTTPNTSALNNGDSYSITFTSAYSSLASNPAILTVLTPSNTISFISSAFGSSSATSNATCTVNVPTGTTTNDLELAYFATGNGSPAAPAGWTLIGTALNNAQTASAYYHFYGTGEPASYSFTGLATPECVILTYRNANLSFPIDTFSTCVAPSTSTGGVNANNCAIPALSPTAGNNELYVGFWDYNPAPHVTGPGQITGPAALQQRFNDGTQRSMWSGDLPINAQGTTPLSQTATAPSADVWDAIGLTLISATSTVGNFTVTSPTAGELKSGVITARGSSGTQWVNVAAWFGSTKISLADNVPSGGTWVLQVDTTKIPNAPGTCPGTISTCPNITFTAYSVPSGQSGGTNTSINVPVDVSNSNSAIFTVSFPTNGTTISGAAQAANGTVGNPTQWTGVQAFFGSTPLSSVVVPSNGAWSLTFATTGIPNGTQTITFQATANGFTPVTQAVNVTVSNGNGFSLGGYTFTTPSFSTTFPNLSRIAGNTAVSSSAFDFYSVNNASGAPNYGAVLCCGVTVGGIDNTNCQPYSLIPANAQPPGQTSGGLRMTYNGSCAADMTTTATDGNGFTQLGGYWEVWARMPGDKNSWPAWWVINGLDGPGGPWTKHLPGQSGDFFEIDIYEIYPSATGTNCGGYNNFSYTSTYHHYTSAGVHDLATTVVDDHTNFAFDTTAAYHRYGLLWDRNQIRIYVDRNNTPIGSIPTPASMFRAGLGILNFGIACNNSGGTPSPLFYDIKEVNVYPLPGPF